MFFFVSLTEAIYKGFMFGFGLFVFVFFFFIAIFLGIPSRALCLDCAESRFNNVSFCSVMQMTSKQRVGK